MKSRENTLETICGTKHDIDFHRQVWLGCQHLQLAEHWAERAAGLGFG